LAGFGWLTRGTSLIYQHPKPLFGGAAVMLVACLLPSLITLPLQFHAIRGGTPLSPSMLLGIMAVSMLFGLLIVPLYAGYLQMIAAADRGLPVLSRDIFKPYRQGQALRLIGYGLAMVVSYVAMFGIVIAAVGRGVGSWYMQVMAAQASHQPPPTALPDGFGITMALFMLLSLFVMGFYAISLGQVALHRRSVFGSIGDGVIGAVKNLLPLLVVAVSAVLAWIAVAIVLVILLFLLALLAKLIGPWLLLVVIIPIYIALFLAIFAVMFGTMYYLWRDVCGDDTVPDMTAAIAA
jgi:hypothetical protein